MYTDRVKFCLSHSDKYHIVLIVLIHEYIFPFYSQDIPPDFELNSLRFLVAFLPICLGLIITNKLPKVSWSDARLLMCGSLAYILYNLLLYTHYIKFAPLGSVGAIVIGSTVFWSTLLTLIFDRYVGGCFVVINLI